MASKSDPRRDTREQVRTLRAQGLSVSQVARKLRITTARVYQILKTEAKP